MSTFTLQQGRSVYFCVQRSASERYPYGICGPFATETQAQAALARINSRYPNTALYLERGMFESDARAMLATDNAKARQRLDQLRA